jgi:aminoacrylate hydrolase
MIFVAGLGGLGGYWRRQVDFFAGSHTTVTFDHRGVGASVKTPPPYTVEHLAADTIALVDDLGFDRVVLIGHSTGSSICQVIAAQHADRVSALVLSGGWSRPDERFRLAFNLRKAVLETLGVREYSQLGFLLTTPLEWGPEESLALAASTSAGSQTGVEVVLGRIDALLAYDAGDRLRSIQCPTLVLAAADDLLVTPDLSRALAHEITGARMEMVDYGGHHFPQTRSALYNRLVSEFLQGVGYLMPTSSA